MNEIGSKPGHRKVPILMYHSLYGQGVKKYDADPVYDIDPVVFNAHLRFLADKGYRTVLLRDFLEWQDGFRDLPEKAVVLSFDDGFATNISVALPALVSYGFVADFFVTTGFLGRPGYMKEGDVLALRDAGMGIGSHSMTHPMLDQLSAGKLQQETAGSKAILEKLLGEPVLNFSLPGGRTNKAVIAAVQDAGYRSICTSRPGLNTSDTDKYGLMRYALRREESLNDRSLQHGGAGIRGLVRHAILSSAKRILGNRVYVKARTAILNRRLDLR